MSEYDCVGVTSEHLNSLKNKIAELEQDMEEYERRLSVSNETIDIYEKLVKHVETQRDDLYQELQSNEMFIEELKRENEYLKTMNDELEQQKAGLEKLSKSRWRIITDIRQQKEELIQAIESALNKSTKGGWLHRIFENIIEKHNIKI